MLASLDITLLEWVQSHRIESLDGVLKVFSLATTAFTVAFILMIGLFSRFKKTCWKKIVQVSLAVLLAAFISYSLKHILSRERPFRAYDTVKKLTRGGSPSFPSGHTVEAFAVATSIALLFRRRKIQIPVFIWACLVGYSRMALGVHYPSDVMGGMLIGIIVALGVNYGLRNWINPP